MLRTIALARLKRRGYFSGLSSPSVTLSRAILASSPQSNSTGQTRFPTFSMNRISISFRSKAPRASMTRLLSRWQPPSVLICTALAPVAATRRASLSVWRSPSMTAMRNSEARSVSVRSSRDVLPAPGELMRFRARMPCLANCSFRLAASFPLASRTLRITGISTISSFIPPRYAGRTARGPFPLNARIARRRLDTAQRNALP